MAEAQTMWLCRCGYLNPGRKPTCGDCGQFRDRGRLAQLDTAIGDPDGLNRLARIGRIADAAVLGSGEQPERTEP